jgi:hypothetical protein
MREQERLGAIVNNSNDTDRWHGGSPNDPVRDFYLLAPILKGNNPERALLKWIWQDQGKQGAYHFKPKAPIQSGDSVGKFVWKLRSD